MQNYSIQDHRLLQPSQNPFLYFIPNLRDFQFFGHSVKMWYYYLKQFEYSQHFQDSNVMIEVKLCYLLLLSRKSDHWHYLPIQTNFYSKSMRRKNKVLQRFDEQTVTFKLFLDFKKSICRFIWNTIQSETISPF